MTVATARRTTRASPRPLLRLLVVDDHPMWRQTLRTVLEHAGAGRVVAEAADGGQAVRLAAHHEPDIVIMDVNLPVLNGIEATRQIMRTRPATRVLVVSSSDAEEQVLAALGAGATGYLVKTVAPGDLADAVRRTAAGELVVSAELSLGGAVQRSAKGGRLVDPRLETTVPVHREPPADLGQLTSRERDVLALMAQGLSNAAIGQSLSLGAKTVEGHVTSIFRKLSVPDGRQASRRVHAVLAYLRAQPPGAGPAIGNPQGQP